MDFPPIGLRRDAHTRAAPRGTHRPGVAHSRAGRPLLVAVALLSACDFRPPEPIRDLPSPAVETLGRDAARVPHGLLPLDGYAIGRLAVAAGGERIFGSVRDGSGERLAEWRWSREEAQWDGPWLLAISLEDADDSGVAISPDGSYLLFSSTRPAGRAGVGDHSLWIARWEDTADPGTAGGWGNPWLVPLVNSSAWDGTPTLSMTGTLYFSSDRDGAGTGRNLYAARLEDGDWSEPFPLPEPVNTSADEADPWVAPDESFLLFSSNRRGVWDLYVAFAMEAGEGWHEPELLGAPVSSDADERSPVLSIGGEVLFFVRNTGEPWWAPSALARVYRPG